MSFTAIIQKVDEGYIGFVEELPGANTQGKTIEEVRENLKEAIQLILEANKEFLSKTIMGKDVIREPINLPS
jgi:predicted RNase H-like HicB family nuclease